MTATVLTATVWYHSDVDGREWAETFDSISAAEDRIFAQCQAAGVTSRESLSTWMFDHIHARLVLRCNCGCDERLN